MSQIIRNSIITPDGTEIVSRHRHDYVSHEDANGKTYAVDGGTAYLRRNAPDDHQESSIVWDGTQPHTFLRTVFEWGSRGRDGQGDLVYHKLEDLDRDHIKAILTTQELSIFMEGLFDMELAYRDEL